MARIRLRHPAEGSFSEARAGVACGQPSEDYLDYSVADCWWFCCGGGMSVFADPRSFGRLWTDSYDQTSSPNPRGIAVADGPDQLATYQAAGATTFVIVPFSGNPLAADPTFGRARILLTQR